MTETQTKPLRRSTRTRLLTRQKLVDAMRRIMVSQDPETATIAGITEEADVGFGSFYNHFESRQDILDAIYSTYSTEFVIISNAILIDETDVSRNISALARIVINKARIDRVWAHFLMKELTSRDQNMSSFKAVFRSQLLLGERLGQLHFPNIDRAMMVLFACLNSFVLDIFSDDQDISLEEDCVQLSMRIVGVSLMQAQSLARMPLPDLVSSQVR